MDFIYYKQVCGNNSLMFFYVNQQTRNVEGVITEISTDNIRSVAFAKDSSCWEDVDNNKYAIDLIERSVQISREEYLKAEELANIMIKSDFWFLSEDKMIVPTKEKEMVAETVIC